MAEGKIYEAIANVMKDVGAVGKDAKNNFDNYVYRSIDGVMNALNPAMVKNHVFVTPTVLDSQREERVNAKGTNMVYTILTVKYSFYTDDGSSVECTVVGEAMDRSDKSSNKAMSAAFKYACFQTFCIPTEEMIDSETETLEMPVEKKKPKAPAKAEKSDEQKNEEMIANVNPDLVPDPNRTPEYRQERVEAEMKRTGVNKPSVFATMGMKSWEDLTDAKFVALMNKFTKQPTKA